VPLAAANALTAIASVDLERRYNARATNLGRKLEIRQSGGEKKKVE